MRGDAGSIADPPSPPHPPLFGRRFGGRGIKANALTSLAAARLALTAVVAAASLAAAVLAAASRALSAAAVATAESISAAAAAVTWRRPPPVHVRVRNDRGVGGLS